MTRLVLRRDLWDNRDYSKPPKQSKTPVRFADVPMHAIFRIDTGRGIGWSICWLKVNRFGAQIMDSSAEHTHQDQNFGDDFMVYPVVYERKTR